MTSASGNVDADSADETWSFRDGIIHGENTRQELGPEVMDCLERWTYARFTPENVLLLGFTTSQPYSDYGSYGEPYRGVMALERDAEPGRWRLIARQYEPDRQQRRVAPTAVEWHPRGALAWIDDGSVNVVVADSSGAGFGFDRWSCCERLSFDASGRYLTTEGPDGAVVYDLEARRVAFEGDEWAPLEVYAAGLIR